MNLLAHRNLSEMNGYKFFLFGCLFTSLTWSFSLYMYWKLNTKPDNYSQIQLFRKENTFEYVKKQKAKYFKSHADKKGYDYYCINVIYYYSVYA